MFDKKQPILGEPTKNDLTLIQDPFRTQHIRSINIHGMPMGNHQYWNAQVDFRVNLTSGMHETGACGSFEEVLQKLKAILDEVQQK